MCGRKHPTAYPLRSMCRRSNAPYSAISRGNISLRHEINGHDVRRSYSICSGLDDGEIRVAVKRVEGGLFQFCE